MVNPGKPGGFFDLDEREAMIEEAVAHLADVRVAVVRGLAVDAADAAGADFMVKGLRTPGDFEIEMQMAHTNKAVSGMQTVFVPCRPALGFLSSRYIREIAPRAATCRHLVPVAVARRLKERESSMTTHDEIDDGVFEDEDPLRSTTPRPCCGGPSTSSPPPAPSRCRRRR